MKNQNKGWWLLMGLNIEIPKDINKIKKQIQTLGFQLKHDTNEKDIRIHTEMIKKLNEELLYREYLALQSKEFKAEVKGYEKLIMPNKDTAIKVNFTWGWLRVYRTKTGQIEWY